MCGNIVIFQNFFFIFWQFFFEKNWNIWQIIIIIIYKKQPKKKKKAKQTLLPSTEKIKSVYYQGKKNHSITLTKESFWRKKKKKNFSIWPKFFAFNNSTQSSDDWEWEGVVDLFLSKGLWLSKKHYHARKHNLSPGIKQTPKNDLIMSAQSLLIVSSLTPTWLLWKILQFMSQFFSLNTNPKPISFFLHTTHKPHLFSWCEL
jgi:hypothetical protein